MRSVLSGGLLGTYLTGPLLKITAEVPMIGGRMIKTNDATAVLSRCLLLSLIISAISREEPQSYSPPRQVRDRVFIFSLSSSS